MNNNKKQAGLEQPSTQQPQKINQDNQTASTSSSLNPVDESIPVNSIFATLNRASTLGYWDNKKDKDRQPTSTIPSNKKAKLEAKSYAVVDKQQREERRDGRRSRKAEGNYNGPSTSSSSTSFRNADARGGVIIREEDYKPEIILQYTDDAGHRLETKKEAFNHLSHKFHGNRPGRNKIDKKLRKQEMESRMKQVNSNDMQASVEMQMEMAKELQSPCIILSKGK